MLSARKKIISKLDKAKKKCSDLVDGVRGKTVVLVKKHSEGMMCLLGKNHCT